jgi:hypothetical protein
LKELKGIWRRFEEFTACDCSRYDVLLDMLTKAIGRRYINCVDVSGGRHIIIFHTDNRAAAGKQPVTALAAHYDRTAGSPGANDNGASVFILTDAAQKLLHKAAENWMVIFTDKEELGAGGKLLRQGSYSLAKSLKAAPVNAPVSGFYIFDACGRGDTLVISTTAETLLKNLHSERAARLRKSVTELRTHALEAARNTNIGKLMLLPTPFSDDAGFFRAGLAAQTITVLPSDEAAVFAQAARADSLNIHALVNSGAERTRNKLKPSFYHPQTWRLLNSPNDQTSTLTPEVFGLIENYAVALIPQGNSR